MNDAFIAIVLFVVAIGIVVVVSHVIRQSAIVEHLESRGFSPQDTGEMQAELESELLFGQRSLGVSSVHRLDGPRGSVLAMEYHFFTGFGRTRRCHRRFRAKCSVPGGWPKFSLSPSPTIFTATLGQLFKPAPPHIGHAGFDERWELEAADPRQVVEFLGPELIEWLAAAPPKESWSLQDGWLCCTWARAVTAEDVSVILERLATCQLALARPTQTGHPPAALAGAEGSTPPETSQS